MERVVVKATEWWPVVDVIRDGYDFTDTVEVPKELLEQYDRAVGEFHAAEQAILAFYPGGSEAFYRRY